MVQHSAAAFDDIAAAFADYGTTVRGYVRYQIAQRNLEPYLKNPLTILDVGGGSGGDSAWLLKQGHSVTYVEPSIEQRRFAERRFNFLLDDGERAGLVSINDSTDSLPSGMQYDVVVLHTVATFQPDPQAFIARMLQYVVPGGVVSLLEKGYYGTELRDIRDANFDDLKHLQKTRRSINNLQQNAYTFKPEELETLFTEAGFEVLEWSGVRLITDDFDMPVEKIGPDRLKAILDAEYEHGHHPAIRGQGQLLHFIARRR